MLPKPPGAKEDPRVVRTRALILDSFMELLAQKGFRSLTVRSITARAGINRATFYAHFSDKYTLLDYAIREAFRQELENRMLNACHYSNGNLLALVVTVCEFTAQSPRHCKSGDGQFEALVAAQVKQQVQALLKLWLAQIGSEVDSEIAATAASWAIYGLALHWSRDKSPELPAEQFAEQVLPLITANLGIGRERRG